MSFLVKIKRFFLHRYQQQTAEAVLEGEFVGKKKVFPP
jgi:hypothetical protein